MEEVRIEDIVEANEERKTTYFKSNLWHLVDHNGHRPGELAVVIAQKGGGKSTLIRTWILELILGGHKVFLHLSEEISRKYLGDIGKSLLQVLQCKIKAQDVLSHLRVQSEKDFSNQYEQRQLVDQIEYRAREFGASVVVYDVFTTSVASRLGVNAEADYAVKFSYLAQRLNVAFIITCHTEKSFRNTEAATGENVRGNATLPNTAANVYVLNALMSHPERPVFLCTDKARYHSKANKQVYRLDYDSRDGIFYKDHRTTAEVMQEFWKKKRERR